MNSKMDMNDIVNYRLMDEISSGVSRFGKSILSLGMASVIMSYLKFEDLQNGLK
jgi:hypothetical protein